MCKVNLSRLTEANRGQTQIISFGLFYFKEVSHKWQSLAIRRGGGLFAYSFPEVAFLSVSSIHLPGKNILQTFDLKEFPLLRDPDSYSAIPIGGVTVPPEDWLIDHASSSYPQYISEVVAKFLPVFGFTCFGSHLLKRLDMVITAVPSSIRLKK